jgi:hypothetical protein
MGSGDDREGPPYVSTSNIRVNNTARLLKMNMEQYPKYLGGGVLTARGEYGMRPCAVVTLVVSIYKELKIPLTSVYAVSTTSCTILYILCIVYCILCRHKNSRDLSPLANYIVQRPPLIGEVTANFCE